MNLNLGIIGHSRSIKIINNIIDENFSDISYTMINAAILSTLPWVYIKNDEIQLLTALLKVNIINNYDIQISI